MPFTIMFPHPLGGAFKVVTARNVALRSATDTKVPKDEIDREPAVFEAATLGTTDISQASRASVAIDVGDATALAHNVVHVVISLGI